MGRTFSVKPITVDTLDRIKRMAAELVRRAPKSLRHCRYADLRLEITEVKSATAENGAGKTSQDDFVFGLGIYHADGSCVYGTNTDLEGLMPQRLDANGRVRFVMPSLDLVAGTYRVDAAVHTRNGRAFDYRRGVVRLVLGSRVHDIGVYRPKHHWKFEGGITFREIDNLKRNVPASVVEAMQSTEKKKP